MEDLGLPAPDTLFGTLGAAVANTGTLLGAIDKFGTRVTIGELLGAGTKLEGLAVIGACSAAFYAGAVIGSLAVASGRYFSGGTSLSDVMDYAIRNQLSRPWLSDTLMRSPGIYNKSAANRNTYRIRHGYI